MSQDGKDQDGPKIIVDSDWKEDAAREKERLAEETKDAGKGPAMPEPSLAELINMIVMQASIGLGGYESPTGEKLPPDMAVAKHYIDLLELMKEKTAGNRSEEETRMLDGITHELRMQYVHVASSPPGSASPRVDPAK